MTSTDYVTLSLSTKVPTGENHGNPYYDSIDKDYALDSRLSSSQIRYLAQQGEAYTYGWWLGAVSSSGMYIAISTNNTSETKTVRDILNGYKDRIRWIVNDADTTIYRIIAVNISTAYYTVREYTHKVSVGNTDMGYLTTSDSATSNYGSITRTTSSTDISGTEAYKSGSVLTSYAFAKSGYVFTGYSGDTGKSSITGNKCVISKTKLADVSITANFRAYYRLSYNTDGGSSVSAQSETSDSATVTLASAPTKSGYNFKGWVINGMTYSAGASYTLTADTTATAKWLDVYSYKVIIGLEEESLTSGYINCTDLSSDSTVKYEEAFTLAYTGETPLTKRQYKIVGEAKKFNTFAKGLLVNGVYHKEYTIDLVTHNGSYFEYYFARKPTYGVEIQSDHGSVSKRHEGTQASDGKYYEGSVLTFTIASDAGYSHLGYAKIVNTATNDVSTATITNNQFVLDGIMCDVKVIVEYEASTYAVSAKAATGHEVAFQSIKVTDASGKEITSAHYDDTVTFTATLKDGYSFLFWRKVGTTSQTASTLSYNVKVTDAVSVEALAAVSCKFNVAYKGGDTGDKTCSISVTYDKGTGTQTTDKTAADIPFSVLHIVSSSLAYALTLGKRDTSNSWQLDYWDADGTILASGASGSINPTAPVSLTAHVAANVTKTLTVFTAWIDAGTSKAALKNVRTRNVFTCQEQDISQAATDGATLLSGDPITAAATFTFSGLKCVKLTTLTSIDFTDSAIDAGQNFRYFSLKAPGEDGAQPAEEDILTYEDSANFLLSASNTVVYAYYGTASQVKVSVAYASLSDSTMGTIAINSSSDETATIDGDGRSATVMQGKTFTAQATALNGYKFAGWYKYDTAMGDPFKTTVRASFTVSAAVTYYAKFVKDTNMVCEWEGSATNKALVWRSKTYESSKPFNPSACRVDALGYAAKSLLELTVAMFSAPDAEATVTTTLTNIASQDARRLPIRRQERYMQVAVKADVEVDALLVGTSMGGLA